MGRPSNHKTITVGQHPGRAICGAGIGVSLVWFLVDLGPVLENPGETSSADRMFGLLALLGAALLAGALAQVVTGVVISLSRLCSGMSTKRRSLLTALPSTLGLFYIVAPRLVELLSGDWVIQQSWRPAALVGLLIATIVFLITTGRFLIELITQHGRLPFYYGLAALAICLLVFLADGHRSLARRYFPAHDILAVFGMVSAAAFGSSLLASRWSRAGLMQMAVGGLVFFLLVSGTWPGESQNVQRLFYKTSRLTARVLARFAPPEKIEELINPELLKSLARESIPENEILDQFFPGRRNNDIILVTIESLRGDFLDANKGANLTPNLSDRFRESTVFANAWSQFPSAKNALHSMFTGNYPTTSATFIHQEATTWSGPSKVPLTLASSLAEIGFSTRAFTSFSEDFFRRESPFLVRGFEQHENESQERTTASDRVVAQAIQALGDDRQDGPPQFLWLHLQHGEQNGATPNQGVDADNEKERYLNKLRRIDRSLERLMSFINASKKKRYVVIHSGHGEELRDHGGIGHHSSLYDEQIAIPLAISGPGIKGQIIDHPVELLDLPATLCSLTSSKRPKNDKGHSLLPLIVGEKVGAIPPALAFSQFREPGFVLGSLDAVRDDRWKLIHDRQLGRYELFDLSLDPFERNDIAKENTPRLLLMKRNLATMRAYAGVESQSDVDDRVYAKAMKGMSVAAPQLEAIARVLRRGPATKPESVIELLQHNDHRVRRLALIHIATYADGLGRAFLNLQVSNVVGRRVDELRLGLALLGEEESHEALEGLDDEFPGIDRMTLAIARFVSGDPSMGPVVHQLLAHPHNNRDLDTLGIYALMRTRDPWLLPSLYVRVNLGMKYSEHRVAAFETASRMSFDLTSPLMRRFINHPDRVLRGRADAFLAEDPSRVEWREQAQRAELFAKEARTMGLSPESLSRATSLYLSALEEMTKVQVFDWGYVMELAFLWTVNDRRAELYDLLTPYMPNEASSKNAFALEIVRRLATISDTADVPVKATLRLIPGQEPRLSESGRVNLLVEVKLAHDSGAIIGSVDRMTEYLGASFLDSRGRPKGETLVLPVSVSGVLPNEKVVLSVPVFIPEDAGNRFRIGIQLGRADNELALPLVIDVNR